MKNKSHSLYWELEDFIRTIEKYNLIATNKDKEQMILNLNDEDGEYKIFKTIVDNKTSYNIFIGNLHIRMEISPNEKVYSIHLKKQEDKWNFTLGDHGEFDYSHPTTQTFRVFMTYDVPVLNITRAAGDSYINGNWNKYVYNTLLLLEEKIIDCTDTAQFNENYK
jgi:hypothetical protein